MPQRCNNNYTNFPFTIGRYFVLKNKNQQQLLRHSSAFVAAPTVSKLSKWNDRLTATLPNFINYLWKTDFSRLYGALSNRCTGLYINGKVNKRLTGLTSVLRPGEGKSSWIKKLVLKFLTIIQAVDGMHANLVLIIKIYYLCILYLVKHTCQTFI